MVLWKEMEELAGYFTVELRFTCDEPLKILNRYFHSKGYDEERACSLSHGVERFLTLQVGEVFQEDGITEFVKGLGTTDLEGQLAHCGRFERLFAEKHKEATRGYQLRGKLRQKLWLLAGIAGVLLLL